MPPRISVPWTATMRGRTARRPAATAGLHPVGGGGVRRVGVTLRAVASR